MLSRTQLDLNEAVEDTRSAVERIAQANRDLQGEITTLREMHSQLAGLNVERQKTIAALADALEVAQEYIRGQMDGPGRGFALEAIRAARNACAGYTEVCRP